MCRGALCAPAGGRRPPLHAGVSVGRDDPARRGYGGLDERRAEVVAPYAYVIGPGGYDRLREPSRYW